MSPPRIAAIGAAMLLVLGGVLLVPSILRDREARDGAAALVVQGERLLTEASATAEKRARDMRVKAVRRGEEALRLVPDFPAAHRLLGRAHMELGNFDRAADHLVLCLEKGGPDPDVSREAGIAWTERWLLSRRVDDRIEAERYLRACLAVHADDAEALRQLERIERALQAPPAPGR